MTNEWQEDAVPLSLKDERTVDSICDAFEAQWIAGRQPVIESYLGDLSDPARTALIRELILLDIGYRYGHGENPPVELYSTRFPQIEIAWLQTMIDTGRQSRTPIASPRALPLSFGDYELMDEVARGGMGVVYKARQVSLNRIVALKMILSGLQASPADVERFHAEAAAAANLDHPGIVPIFEVGAFQGQHYFSMGFIEGRSLAERLAQGPVAAREAARLAQSLCVAVQYAHDHQVIHRDLKPANILLDRDGRPRVTDFGLAKCLTDDCGRTRSGQAFGTPSYIPPEQAAGKLEAIGPAADIYALGAILYAMLTGRPPFQAASSVDTLRQVIDNEPLRPSELAPGTPRDLETIALKCLQKRIVDRYESARALGEDLGRYLDGRTILARPISRWERGWRWCRRYPYLALLGSTVAILITLIAVVSTVAASKYREQLKRAENAVQAENLAKQDALAKLWNSYLVSARAGRMSKQPGQRFASLRAIASAMALATPTGRSIDELRTEAIAAMMLPDFEEAKSCPGYPKGTLAVAIAPTFERYAMGGADGRVSVRQAADDSELCQLPGTGPLPAYGGLIFGADGRYLIQQCETSQGIMRRIWRLQRFPALALSSAGACEFSPDGRQIATVDGAAIRLADLESGKELRRYPFAGPAADFLMWNPRRSLLFARSADHRSYRLLDLATGTLGPAVAMPNGISWPDWHPEGRMLAIADYASPHPKIRLIDADTGALRMPPLEAHRTGGMIVCFNHYGDRLLSTDWSGLWRLWDVRTGKLLLTQPAGGNELRFSNDDRRAGLETMPEAMRSFRFESGREFYKIVHRVKSIAGVFANFERGSCPLDREGRLLAYPVSEGVAVVDLVRGEEAALLPMADAFPVGADDSGALYTHGSAGLLKWPMTHNAVSGQRVYGPPQKLAPPMGRVLDGGASDKKCNVFALGNFNEGAIELMLDGGRQIRLGPQEDVRHCAVSPDGRWIATGSHGNLKGPAAAVWNAKTGKHERDLPVTAMCDVAFSADGRWLLTSGGGARLWSVGDWKEGVKLGPSAKFGAFSSKGDLLALQDVPGVVRLVRCASGKEVARLTAPEAVRLAPLYFTRDESRLVCWIGDEEMLCVFNLALIRSKLASIGLDWEFPPFPAVGDRLPEPIAVKFTTNS